MSEYCKSIDGHKMANMLEGGLTPFLPPEELETIGFSLAAYPLTLLNASIFGMRGALSALKTGDPSPFPLGFDELQRVVGFPEYYDAEVRYKVK